MEQENLVDVGDPVHIECLPYSFGSVIEKSILITTVEWNEHRIRKQNNRNLLGVIPNEMYEWPAKFGCADFKRNVNLDHV